MIHLTIAEAGPFWTIHLVYCENVIARGLTILTKQKPGGPKPPNTDGLNLDSSRNVPVEHCLFDVGDDVVCLKSGINEDGRRAAIVQATSHRPVENVVLENVTLTAKSGLRFEWVRGLRLRQVTSTPEAGEPISFSNCEQVDHVPPPTSGAGSRSPVSCNRD